MMNAKRILIMVCLLLSAAGTLLAQGHWPVVNPHDYQYDMTAYVQLTTASGNVLNQSDYEVAAFCSRECRGTGKLLTAADGTQLISLRIRSNETSGETIYFRVYQLSTGKELYPSTAISFEAQTVVGTPSEPMSLIVASVLLGDVNGNGGVDIGDAVSIVNYLVGKESTNFVEKAADTNKNGQIDIGDAVTIVNFLVGKTESLSRQANMEGSEEEPQ